MCSITGLSGIFSYLAMDHNELSRTWTFAKSAARVDYTRSLIIARRASLRTLLRSYEKPASRCTGDLCSFFPLLIWLFPLFQLCRGVCLPHRFIRTVMCVSFGRKPTWLDARSKNPSARIYLISLLYAETGWPNRLNVFSDCGYTSSPQSNWICSVDNSVHEETSQTDYSNFPC